MTVEIGARVQVRLFHGAVREFSIVFEGGMPEAGIISHRSPLGAALLGHRAGETVSYKVGANSFQAEIIEIRTAVESR